MNTVSSACPIFAIPPMCDAAFISSAITTGEYDYPAPYPIGAFATLLNGYDPSNATFAVYNFQPEDVKNTWEPFVYTVQSGAIISTVSGGVYPGNNSNSTMQCASNYNTQDTEYTLVSWYRTAILATSDTTVV